MSRQTLRTPLLGFAAALIATAALAAGLSGAEAAKDRHIHMKALGATAKALVEQARSTAPDPAVVRMQVAKVAASAKALPGWFPVGSGKESGVKTAALAPIWSDQAGFAKAAARFADEAAHLDAVAGAGDMSGFTAQLKLTLGACKGCHDKYREPEKS